MNEYKSVNYEVNILPQNDDDRATSDRFDRVFWKRFWRLVRPYWASERRGQASCWFRQ